MALKSVHESQDEIPEQYQDLYSERDGKWELTGIAGVKTPADIGRLQASLDKEKQAHKTTKDGLGKWGELGDIEDVQAKLDRYPELEAASKGKLDESEIQEAVDRRVEATIKTRLAPVERENNKLKAQFEDGLAELATLRGEKKLRTIHDEIDKAVVDLKANPEYKDDIRMWGERVLDVTDDGVLTKDGAGVTPSMDAKSWLEEMLPKRPAWGPNSKGANSRGSGNVGGFIGSNPWGGESWNVTDQARVIKEKGMETAQKMAKAANSRVGATSPTVKK